jgi:anti-sigma regulatory factor (Ser/Thr protein kinase)
VSTLWVRHAPSSAAVARRSVQAAFQQAGLSAEDGYNAALITSELVANAVRHARALPSGHLAIEWLLDDTGYLISVTDGGSRLVGHIVAQAADVQDITGRGLMIVAALSRSWGVADGAETTTVWARGDYAATDSRAGELQSTG